MVRCDLFVAAAIEAERLAEWQVQVEADPFFIVVPVESGHKFRFPAVLVRRLFPEGDGGITGIAGYGLVITGEKGS